MPAQNKTTLQVVLSTYSPLFSKAVSPEVKMRAHDLLTRRLEYVETELANKLYLMGERFTVADAYMFVVVRWSDLVGFDLARFPKTKEYLARISARPAVQAAMKAEGLLQ